MMAVLACLWHAPAARAEPGTASTPPGAGMTVTAPEGRASFTVRGRFQLRETVALPAEVVDAAAWSATMLLDASF